MANPSKFILLALWLAILTLAAPARAQTNPCDCSFPCQMVQGLVYGPAIPPVRGARRAAADGASLCGCSAACLRAEPITRGLMGLRGAWRFA